MESAHDTIISLDAAAVEAAVAKAATPKPKAKRKSRAKPKASAATPPEMERQVQVSAPLPADVPNDPEQRKQKLIELIQRMVRDDPSLALPDVRMDDALVTVER